MTRAAALNRSSEDELSIGFLTQGRHHQEEKNGCERSVIGSNGQRNGARPCCGCL
jgi:hypothetical protein